MLPSCGKHITRKREEIRATMIQVDLHIHGMEMLDNQSDQNDVELGLECRYHLIDHGGENGSSI